MKLKIGEIIGGRFMMLLGLMLIYLSSSLGGDPSQPGQSQQFPAIPANLTDQDYITAVLASTDDPQWCRKNSNFVNSFYGFLCIYYINAGEWLSCVTICERDNEECASVFRCGRFPQKTDGTKLNVTFYMVHRNESAYRPTTTRYPITMNNLSKSNKAQNFALRGTPTVLTNTEKPSYLLGAEIAGTVLGAFAAITLIVLGVVLYVIPNFRRREGGYESPAI